MEDALRGATDDLYAYGGKIDAAFRALAEVVSSQGAELRNVRAELERKARVEDLESFRRSLEDRFSLLERRIDVIESSLSIDSGGGGGGGGGVGGGAGTSLSASGTLSMLDSTMGPRGKSGSIGDIVARHERMLEETMAALEQRALQSQVAAIADEVRLEAKASLEAVAAEKASGDVVRRLQATQKEMLDQVAAVQATVATKMDRVDLRHLESTMQSITEFEDFQQHTRAALTALAGTDAELRNAITEAEKQHNELDSAVSALSQDVDTRAYRATVAALEERVGAAEEALAGTAARSRVASLEGRLEESLSTLHALEEAVKTSVRDSSERYASVVEELRHKEDGAKLTARVDSIAGQLQQRVQQVEQDLAGKAWIESLEQSDAHINKLVAQQEDLARRVQIALKFVQWYSEHGKAYEHNAAAIEQKYKDMALRAKAATVRPAKAPGPPVAAAAPVAPLRNVYGTSSMSQRGYYGGGASGSAATTAATTAAVDTLPRVGERGYPYGGVRLVGADGTGVYRVQRVPQPSTAEHAPPRGSATATSATATVTPAITTSSTTTTR